MSPYTYDITSPVASGEYVELFAATDVDGNSLDLTGCTARMQLRQYGAQPGAALLTLSNQASDAEGVWIVEPSGGQYQIRVHKNTLTALYGSQSAGLPAGAILTFVYDLIVTQNGTDNVFQMGKFILQPGVTQP